MPLTDTRVAPEELLGGGGAASTPVTDATVTRTLTKGEPVAAPSGRADDFSWPRGAVNEPGAVEPTTAGTAGPDAGTKFTKPAQRSSVERNPHMTLEQIRQAAYGPWEFHSEKWELAYIKRERRHPSPRWTSRST